MTRSLALASAIGIVALAAPGAARAIGNCKNFAVSGVAFGNYDPVAANRTAPLDGAGAVAYDCTPPDAPVISMSWGQNASGGVRRLRSGTSLLLYNLYTDATRATVWADGSFGSVQVTGPAVHNGNVPVYGRISAAQDVSPGSYSDTIVVTFNF